MLKASPGQRHSG